VLEQLIEQACNLYDWIALLWAASGEAPGKERLANVNYRRALLPISECKSLFWTRVNWIGKFITYLCRDNGHRNILAWNDYWGLEPATGATALTNPPPPGQTFSRYSYAFAKLYQQIDQTSRQYSPYPGVLGVIGTAQLQMWGDTVPGAYQVLRGSGYSFDWSAVQQNAATMHALLTALYGYSKDPDFYTLGIYHANSWDLYNGLYNLTNNYSNGFTLPPSKIFVNEWATSSALGPTGIPYWAYTTDAEQYNGWPIYGDNQDPTMTAADQVGWVQNTLCAFNQIGIQKAAHWALYDPYTLFSTPPWSYVGQGLAWTYWGLAYEEASLGNKPAWSVVQQYYQYGTLSCPSGGTVYNASPLLSFTPLTSYYTINQPVRLTWTASDVSSISVPGASKTIDCYVYAQSPVISSTVAAASCASTDAPYQTYTGNYTITATAIGTNGNPNNQTSASATVQIGLGPNLTAITNQYYSYTIRASDEMILWGQGFSNEKVNAIQCTRSGYSDVWMYDGDGVNLDWESNTQINVNLANRLAPGVWTIQEWNGYSGYSSNSYQVTITQ
jgi:hypothetical protein